MDRRGFFKAVAGLAAAPLAPAAVPAEGRVVLGEASHEMTTVEYAAEQSMAVPAEEIAEVARLDVTAADIIAGAMAFLNGELG